MVKKCNSGVTRIVSPGLPTCIETFTIKNIVITGNVYLLHFYYFTSSNNILMVGLVLAQSYLSFVSLFLAWFVLYEDHKKILDLAAVSKNIVCWQYFSSSGIIIILGQSTEPVIPWNRGIRLWAILFTDKQSKWCRLKRDITSTLAIILDEKVHTTATPFSFEQR